MKPIHTISLCSGYDSQVLALQRVQSWHPEFAFDHVAWAEIDPRAICAHDIIHPSLRGRNIGDITTADYSPLACDLLFYSPPCQSVSIAGRQAGMEKGSDAASALVWHIERAINTLHPKYLIYENVKNVLSARHRPDFAQWCRLLESYGYANFYQVIDAANCGVPQHRERVFMVSILRTDTDPKPAYAFPRPNIAPRCINDILESPADIPDRYYIPDEKVTAMATKMAKSDIALYSTPTSQARILGYSRDSKGKVVNYHLKDIANTVTCYTGKGSNADMFVISPRLRRVGNIAKPRQKVTDPEEGRVYASSGVSPTIKASRNQTLILTPPRILRIGDLDGYSGGQAGRIYHPAGLSPTIDTSTGGNSMPKIAQSQPFSVRRLTPREVYRVQDVDDSSIDLLLAATDDKGKPALSLTSHYFLAGNSIAVAPLAYIIESLFFAPAPPRQPTIFD